MGVLSGCVSIVLDTFASSMSFIALYPDMPENALFYKIVAFSSAMGGSVLMLGSMSGLALLKMEHIRVGWFLRHIGWVVALSWLLGLAALWLIG